MLGTIIATGALVVIIGAAIRYIIKEKKKGTKCIGCPAANSCCSNSCSGETQEIERKLREALEKDK